MAACPAAMLQSFFSVDQHLQGKIASLGVLKSARDWYNSLIVLVLVGAGAMSFFLVANVSETQAASRRKAAARELGLE
jgi:predicted Abi (CAAX) family protease